MGLRLTHLLQEHPTLEIAGALVRGSSKHCGKDLGVVAGLSTLGINLSDDIAEAFANVDAVIDFSAPAACQSLAPEAARHGVAYVVGSTGLSDDDRKALAQAAQQTPVFLAANFSVGIHVLSEVVRKAAAMLGNDFDIEINETHHRNKRDAPSGTAWRLGEAANEGRTNALQNIYGRPSGTPRADDEIGYSAIRGGDVAGEHTVFFLGQGERLELTHRAGHRDIFVRGALGATAWIIGRPPGLYGMGDWLRDAP